MPGGNTLNITFDDKKTSVEKIIAALKHGDLNIEGKPVLIK